MIGFIGGSGLEAFIEEGEGINVKTPYGSVTTTRGRIGGTEVVFLSRHGPEHEFPPHKVNYRGNVYAMRKMGVRKVLSSSAVGGLSEGMEPGIIVFPDQQIDNTRGRVYTFYDDRTVHVDFTEPYCSVMRRILIQTSDRLGVSCQNEGTYICFEGPRFETAAEIRMATMLGADVVGMTGSPETALARELGLCYATVCIVSNWGAGMQEKISHRDALRILEENRETVGSLLRSSAQDLDSFEREGECVRYDRLGDEFVRRMEE